MESKYLMGSPIEQWQEGKAYEVTFIVTEDCNLRCSYCYQIHKNNKNRMSLETAKKAVDYLLDNSEIYKAEAVIWDFIGGEPLLEIELIDKLCDYIKVKTYKMGHKWALNYRINIGTNGTLYDAPKVNKFINKNKGKASIGITIDGTKRKHDLHRVYVNGKGSYDDVYKNIPKWIADFPDATTKVTFGSEDLIYLKESIIHLWSSGIKNVPANVVFENVWRDGDDEVFEKQMKELADYIIDNNLWNDVNTTLFSDSLGLPNDKSSINSNYCGTGRMLAIDANGNFYPCLRFSDFTLDNKPGISIGNADDGLNLEKLRPFLALSTKAISKKECLDCEIASGCAWCQGCNYDCSNIDTIYTRATYICKMHKARVRANNYYWDRLQREKNIRREGGLKSKKNMYFIMADDASEHCNYNSKKESNIVMDKEIAKKGLEFCEKYFFKPVILNSKKGDRILNLDELSTLSRLEIVDQGIELPYRNNDSFIVVEANNIDSFEGSKIVLLNIHNSDVKRLAEIVEKLIPKCTRINIIFKFDIINIDMNLYRNELEKIEKILFDYLSKKIFKEINVITDRLFLEDMNNCDCGENNFALAPNGKIYVCPAYYYEDENQFVGDLENGITDLDLLQTFSYDNSPVCKRCDAYQCNRCVFENKHITGEHNIPSSNQCIKSHIERNVSMNLQKKLEKQKIEFGFGKSILEVKYLDPIEIIISELEVNPY